tara:strand:- start:300 stop:1007 length:708 start_codon:yes stop_codon:yes gene_type:complete
MTIVYSASPGTGSKSLNKRLEIILNSKSILLNSYSGIGHIALNIPLKKKILKKLNLNFLDRTRLIYGHIFPTKKNLSLLNNYYNVDHYIISYRNIFEQLNYFYKWQKYVLRSPLNFPEEKNFKSNIKFRSDNFNIDLNLILVLNFYKYWFYLIQNDEIKNFTLISFEEIKTMNENYKKKIFNIFKNINNKKSAKFDVSITEGLKNKEEFEILPRHKNIINEFISFNNEVDFNLII